MKYILKLTIVSLLSVSFFLSSCSKDNIKKTESLVTMRNFVQADAGSDQIEEGEIKRMSHEVSDNLKSTVFKLEEGQMVSCDCYMDDFEITQVFLKPQMLSGKHTFLYGNQNGSTTIATHTFTGEDVIGIDMNYNGEYVRMSDIDVFSAESSVIEITHLSGELGVEVFANGNRRNYIRLFIIFLLGVTNQIQEILYLECG